MTDTSGPPPSAKLNVTKPHSARIWNYWLGGKDHYAADRLVGDRIREAQPDMTRRTRSSAAC